MDPDGAFCHEITTKSVNSGTDQKQLYPIGNQTVRFISKNEHHRIFRTMKGQLLPVLSFFYSRNKTIGYLAIN